MDVFTKKKRSEIMSRIRAKNTKLEIEFLKLLSSQIYPKGFRYIKHCSKLPGKPDIVFPKHKLAVFIDGDFWHGYQFAKNKDRLPKKYWLQKIEDNIKRDKKNQIKLRKAGWKVLRIWEHEIKKNPSNAIKKVGSILLNL